MKKSLYIGILFLVSLIIDGCGGGSDTTENNTNTTFTVTLQGFVNDTVIANATVKLVLFKSKNLLVTSTITTNSYGEWSTEVDKNDVPKDDYIMIYATNPENNSTIRSIIYTADVLNADKEFKSEETTVSHYTEAALAIAETDTGINQKSFDKIKSLIVLDNGEPTATGYNALDELASVVKLNFDNSESSQDKLNLAVYKKLLDNKIASAVPDEFGRIEILLPTEYNDKISLDMNSSSVQVSIEDNKLILDTGSQQLQTDINLTINAQLNSESTQESTTLYAIGNSKNHYIYTAKAPSTELMAEKTALMINGRYYTIIPYSFISIMQNDADIEALTIRGTINGRNFNAIKIATNYVNSKTVVKVYEGKDIFDETTLVGESDIVKLASNDVNIGNINLTRENDFRPIAPKDANIELPPVAPEF